MGQNDDALDEDGGGFDVDDWSRLTPFAGAVATLDDVQAGKAVFALGDQFNKPLAGSPAEKLVHDANLCCLIKFLDASDNFNEKL